LINLRETIVSLYLAVIKRYALFIGLDSLEKFAALLVSKSEVKIGRRVAAINLNSCDIIRNSVLIRFSVQIGIREVVIGIDKHRVGIDCVAKGCKCFVKQACPIISIAQIVVEGSVAWGDFKGDLKHINR